MSARPESWSPPASSPWATAFAAIAMAVFFAAWGGLHYGFYDHDQIVDTPIYEHYGDAMADGQVPYRDFAVEYPPAALPVFVLPSLSAAPNDLPAYRRVFEGLMAFCGGLAVALVALILVRDGAGPGRVAGALGVAALAPLALGSVILSRFDLWPAALTVAALAALVLGRQRLGLGVLGLAVAAKLYPGVLLPIALAYVWRRSGRREALVCGAIFAGIAAVCYLPFLVLAPGGVWHSISVQTSRPLQIESLGSSLLLAAHQVFGTSLTMRSGHGSQNLAGGAADTLALLQTIVQVVALLYIWTTFARGAPTRERLLCSSAAAVCAFIALGKVLSPQFVIWLIPLVPLVRGRRGAAAGALLIAAMVLTQLWFPFRYWDLALHFKATPSWLVFARDLTLVGLLAVLVWPARTRPGSVPGLARAD